jgi:hypothetical protein
MPAHYFPATDTLTHPNAVLATSHRALSNCATPAADVMTGPPSRRFARPVNPMAISDRLPTATRAVYDPPLWSRFSRPAMTPGG